MSDRLKDRFVAESKYFVWYLLIGSVSAFASIAVESDRWWESVKYLDMDPMGTIDAFFRNYFPAFIKTYLLLAGARFIFVLLHGRFWRNQTRIPTE